MGNKILIGLKTVDRLQSFQRLLKGIYQNTTCPYSLLVVCDERDHDSIQYCEDHRLSYLVSYKRCHTAADNLLFYAYYHHTKPEIMVSVEDDVRILGRGWQSDWVQGAEKWGMMCHSFVNKGQPDRLPTWQDPFFQESECGFQIFAVSREALSRVGLPSLAYFGSHSDTELVRRHCIRMVKSDEWPTDHDDAFPNLFTEKAGADWSMETTTGCNIPDKAAHNYMVYSFRWQEWVTHNHGVVHWEPWQSPGEREFFLDAIDDWLDNRRDWMNPITP